MLLQCFPLSLTSALCGWLSRTIGPHLSVHKIAEHNMRTTLPYLTTEEVKHRLHCMWDNLGRTVGEFAILGKNHQLFYPHINVHGQEHITQAKAEGRKIIFFSAHYGNWEMMPLAATFINHPMSVVYRPANNPFVDRMINKVRLHYVLAIYAKGSQGLRALVKALQQGDNIGILIDQKMSNGIDIPFLGYVAPTSTVIAQLALKYDCLLMPIRIVRKGSSATFDVYYEAGIDPRTLPITLTEEEREGQLLAALHTTLESWIYAAPEQWFWVHKRWTKSFYKKLLDNK